MAEIFIPTLHTFENSNVFTGSFGKLRFKITPDVTMMPGGKEVDNSCSTMLAEVWHGLLCYEKSQIEEKKEFPLTEEGKQEMTDWLLSCV